MSSLEVFLKIKVLAFFQKSKNIQMLEEVAALQIENNHLKIFFPYAMPCILSNFGKLSKMHGLQDFFPSDN